MKWLLNCLLLTLLLTNQANAIAPLLPDEQNTIDVFEKVSPNVVYVHRISRVIDRSWQAYEVPIGAGSGILWDKQGHVVTNYHVIQGAQKIAITLNQGQTVTATIIGVEPRKDIAVLKINNNDNKHYSPIPLANSDELLVGQKAIAIGNPYGLNRTLTTGIISALGRRVPGVAGVTIPDMIQTDASINPGNSGGPLLDSRGQIIGMNTMIFSRSGASAGIGFAVPINNIKRYVNQIIKLGRVIQAGIGIQRLPDNIARQLGIRGVIIGEVVANTPADKADLQGTYRDEFGRLVLGDIIVQIDKQRVRNYDDLYNYLADINVGDTVTITIEREGKELSFKLKTVDLNQAR